MSPAAWVAVGVAGWLATAVVTAVILARVIRLRELHDPVMDVARHLHVVQADDERVQR